MQMIKFADAALNDCKILFTHYLVSSPQETTLSDNDFRDHHKVFLIKTKGKARQKHEIKHIAYYKPGGDIKLSHTTKSFIDRYYNGKKQSIFYRLFNIFR